MLGPGVAQHVRQCLLNNLVQRMAGQGGEGPGGALFYQAHPHPRASHPGHQRLQIGAGALPTQRGRHLETTQQGLDLVEGVAGPTISDLQRLPGQPRVVLYGLVCQLSLQTDDGKGMPKGVMQLPRQLQSLIQAGALDGCCFEVGSCAQALDAKRMSAPP